MDLLPNGMDIFYIDESERHPLSLASSIIIPFLRPKGDGGWKFVWQNHLDEATAWRRNLSRNHSVRFREELHGYKILKCQGLYHRTHRNLAPIEAVNFYKDALATLTWLPNASVFSAFATETSELMGHKGIAACLFGLFQRMRKHCETNQRNGLVFFDEGHISYIKLYRMAQKFLPTGSSLGRWDNGRLTKNMPLIQFPKDASMKVSELSYFMQIADLISYAARIKIEQELGKLAAKRVAREHHTVYDALPAEKLRTVSTKKRRDAIVPI
ncbi:DUF3800 domain-containing protein [Rhodopseudomonas palustris]|uniref:DUF3800 domain-containing protein n=1 Tax=Rhodopseudomonas palustris TaxID=1076 RepID=A0A418VIC5_RHOPL|nr:DUF3800 domain-containing protein [Rhodopseudomonas palustris]RJF75843.1 DUF3800 domain-containing protein [Rhodopseudomonas palustris]